MLLPTVCTSRKPEYKKKLKANQTNQTGPFGLLHGLMELFSKRNKTRYSGSVPGSAIMNHGSNQTGHLTTYICTRKTVSVNTLHLYHQRLYKIHPSTAIFLFLFKVLSQYFSILLGL